MGYKQTAILIIIALTLYIALVIENYGRDKVNFHISVIDFITYVKQQIKFFCTPTDKIIAGYRENSQLDIGFFESGGIDSNIYLDTRGKKLLNEFFSRLGKSSAEDQIASCDYTITSIKALLDEYKEEVQKKYKAYSVMALISGAMLIILLL